MSNLRVELTSNPKQKPVDESKLTFGDLFTDHMLIVNYDEGEGWHDARIIPYGPLALDPSAMCLHYGQEVFEGMKAYRAQDGRILLFRPDENFKRLNLSNERMCIPQVDEAFMLDCLNKFVSIESSWVPRSADASLYLRPFIIAVDPHLGVRAGSHYLYIVIASPVGAYYPEGLDPVKIYVETNYVRTVKGGTGFTKTAGNYSASLKAQYEAKAKNYTQVLWLDGVERRYIEEVGTMNVFFKIDGEVITPSLDGSVLGGITRKSAIELMRGWGIKVTERRISIDEVAKAYEDGKLEEAFGTGTAAVVSPIGHLNWGDKKIMEINNGKIGALSQRLYDELTRIQWGKIADSYGWTVEIR